MKQRATVICRRGRQLLFVRRAGSKWNLPGGRPLRSESLKQGAFRELKEETGLAPNEIVLIARFETSSVEHFVFLADFEKDYFAPMPLNEITECKWCSDWPRVLTMTADSKLILRTFHDDIRAL